MNPYTGLRPMNVLLAMDGSDHAAAAVSLLSDLIRCQTFPASMTISAVAVLDTHHTYRRSLLEGALTTTRDLLQELNVQVQIGLLHGHPAQEILRFADEEEVDLIIMGAKGLRATLGILLGGVAQQVVEHSRQPVLVVRAPYTDLKQIVYVTDGSSSSQAARDYLKIFPLPTESRLSILHVLPPLALPDVRTTLPWSSGVEPIGIAPIEPKEMEHWRAEEERAGRDLLDHSLEELKATGLEIEPVLLRGDAATELIEWVNAHGASLIVAGCRGLSAVEGWLLGSVSRKLIHYAGCSVLVVKEA